MAEEQKVRGAGLSRDKVLAAALAIADADGLDAVSFRRLAGDLGVTPMALYRYVDDKEALLDGIADLVLSQLELPEPSTGDWRKQLRAAAWSFRAALVAHPAVVPIFLRRPLLTPAGLNSANALVGIFHQAGFPPEQVAPLYRDFMRDLLAHVMLESEGGRGVVTPEERSEQARLARITFETLPAEKFPHLVEAAPYFAAPHDPELAFQTGLDLFIAGLEQRRSATQPGPPRPRKRR